RTALAGLGLLAAGASAFLVVTGLSVRAAIAAIARAHCQLTPSICFPLYQKAGSWTGIYGPQWTLALPGVAAVFIGAPMIARGYETGSLRFALTQGVRRARWVVPQFLVAAAAGVVACVVAALIGTWWLNLYHGPYILAPWRWNTILFNITPVMLPCWLLLGISIGALAAVTVRRIVPAMAATLASAVALAIAADRLRLLPNALLAFGAHTARQSGALWTVCSSSGCIFGDPAGQAYRAGIIAKGWFTHAGQRLTASQAADLAARIPHNGMNAPSAAYLGRWLAARHYTYWISFQPDSHYWLFQGAQAALLVTLAVALGALAIWLLVRRPV
ncbi:MAG: ABC transporter permease subunit, partial [Actinobacteria bacterium]|nr:ABC transporter permease subunit [Actinomycetota bacterium]